MKIIRNTIPISDIYNMMKSGELVVNKSYQRGTGLWPENARSYFIDTILNDFPFPKAVIQQGVDLKTKKSKREIIDGQQRLTTIRDYIDNKFKLTAVSKKFQGLTFDELDEDIRASFLAYEVSIDNIVTATREEILEIFRRINSYTLPLNTAELRHATYQGQFKWFISDLTEVFSPFLENYDIVSIRDISRMMDADLLTECSQICLEGIQARSTSKLEALYKKYDETFTEEEQVRTMLEGAFNFIKDNFNDVFEACNVKSYNFYSLMGALIFNKFNIPDEKDDLVELTSIGHYCVNANRSSELLRRIFGEVDDRNEMGTYSEFVKASISTTQSYKHRLVRIKVLISALQEQ
ncbi:DUF262 domain-containing protein [Chitinophaga sp. XS-30]|uniref:DUF262 domain-containing protein n=1 Tax=Chitinophaga sp. XS-30 TaxID=2604421 RepID=UPI0011DDBBD4|nr:DUF262 domain-containing protein [Chitinophaga sp. XS-30]QEH39356.1 DUF262 domain-containing protein [Chitinophaga sp. XS-30]